MKDFKKILSVFALTAFVIIALGFMASNANATDDCNGVQDTGAAYGWCTAYCAMGCDGATFKPGCEKVNSQYHEATGEFISCGGGVQCTEGEFQACFNAGFPNCCAHRCTDSHCTEG